MKFTREHKDKFNEIIQTCKDAHLDKNYAKHYLKDYGCYLYGGFRFHSDGVMPLIGFGMVVGTMLFDYFSGDLARHAINYLELWGMPRNELISKAVQLSLVTPVTLYTARFMAKCMAEKIGMPRYETIKQIAQNNRKAIQGKFDEIPEDFNLKKMF